MEHKKGENKVRAGRLPSWLKRPLGGGKDFAQVEGVLADLGLATVCRSAGCPNRGECFSCGTATFMIMGEVCTRNCEFCLVAHGEVAPLAADEPQRVAEAVQRMGLKHVVITSVTRDDLADGGAEHFAATIEAVRKGNKQVTIEVLTPDFKGDTGCLDAVVAARPDVFNHNVETTRRLTPEIRSGADYDRSLGVLKYVADIPNGPTAKSGLMLGLGESDDEIIETIKDLRAAGVELLTIGQYLRPGKANREVHKYYEPAEFEKLKEAALEMGFKQVASGPFVRSSYHAEEMTGKIFNREETMKPEPPVGYNTGS